MIKKKDDWVVFGKQAKRHLFFFEDKVLDLTNFLGEHPGGKKALGNYVFKDVTDIIFSVYPHKRETTIRKLNTFIIGKIPSTQIKSPKIQRSSTPIKDNKQKKKVCFAKKNHINSQKQLLKQEEGHLSSSISKSTKENSIQERKLSLSEKKERSSKRPKSKEKSQKGTRAKEAKEQPGELHSLKTLSQDLDEEKPAFKVPILRVKHMNQLE